MFDHELVKEILLQLIGSIEKIEHRFKTIQKPNDFIDSDEGQVILDSICMQLIAIGESLKNIDKISNGELLVKYQEMDWKKAMGMRDIISHHYFDIDAEIVFPVCEIEIPKMKSAITRMMRTL